MRTNTANLSTTTTKHSLAPLVPLSLFGWVALPAAALSFALAAPNLAYAQSNTADDDDLEEIIVTARRRNEALSDVPVAVSAFSDQQIKDLNIRSVDDIAKHTPGLSFSRAFGRSTERPAIRGLFNILAGTAPLAESGAGYFIDGIYFPGDILSLDVATLERVEVTKGPQSALYGRNTYSGAINFVTKGMGDRELAAKLTGSVGDPGETRLNAVVDIPLGDNMLLDVIYNSNSYDGEWDNLATGQVIGGEESTSLMVGFHYAANRSNLKIRYWNSQDTDDTRALQLQRSDYNNCYPGFRSNFYRATPMTQTVRRGTPQPVVAPDNQNQYFCGTVQTLPYVRLNDVPTLEGYSEFIFGLPSSTTVTNDNTPGVAFSGVERDRTWLGLRYDLHFDAVDLQIQLANGSNTLKTGSDSDHWDLRWYSGFIGAPPPNPAAGRPLAPSFFNFSGQDEYDDTSVEVRVSSTADKPFQWSAGVFNYGWERSSQNINWIYPGPVVGLVPGLDEYSVDNTAFFGSLSYAFESGLNLSLELRSADEDKSLLDRSTATARTNTAAAVVDDTATTEVDETMPATVATDTFTVTETRNAARSFSSSTYRFTADYKLNDSVLLYGVLSTGNKPGGVNNQAAADEGFPIFEEEESANTEFGAKFDLDSWYVGIAYYMMDIKQLQLTTPLADPNGLLASAVSNQGDAEVTGLEVDFSGKLSDLVSIGGSFTDLTPEITRGCDQFHYILTSGGYRMSETPNVPVLAALVPDNWAEYVLPGATCSIAGKQIPGTSTLQWNFWLAYDGQLSPALQFRLSGNVAFEGEKYAQIHNGMSTGDAQEVGLRFEVLAKNWTLSLIGTNLTDEDAPVALTRWGDYGQGSTLSARGPALATALETLVPDGLPVPPELISSAATYLDTSSGVRGPFASLRRGTALNVEFQYRF